MKKIDVSQTINTLASVGVIVGIALLAIELRQNNDLLENQANETYIRNRLDLGILRFADDEFAEILYMGNNGEQLTGLEQFKLNEYYTTTLIAMEWEYLQYRRGYHRDLPLDAWRMFMNRWPGMRELATDMHMNSDFGEFLRQEVFQTD